MAAPTLLIETGLGQHVLLTDRTARIELVSGCWDGFAFCAARVEQLWITDHPELATLSTGKTWNMCEVFDLLADVECPPDKLRAWEYVGATT